MPRQRRRLWRALRCGRAGAWRVAAFYAAADPAVQLLPPPINLYQWQRKPAAGRDREGLGVGWDEIAPVHGAVCGGGRGCEFLQSLGL